MAETIQWKEYMNGESTYTVRFVGEIYSNNCTYLVYGTNYTHRDVNTLIIPRIHTVMLAGSWVFTMIVCSNSAATRRQTRYLDDWLLVPF